MASDAQHIIIKTTNGNFATTSFGPRKTTSNVPLARPMSWVKRQITIPMDGDENPTVVADLADDSMNVFPAGCFITDVYAWSETGASVAITATDGTNTANLPVVAPAAGEWAAARDADINIAESSYIGWTIGAGETAVVQIEYLAPETKGDGGVLHRTRTNEVEAGVDTL